MKRRGIFAARDPKNKMKWMMADHARLSAPGWIASPLETATGRVTETQLSPANAAEVRGIKGNFTLMPTPLA
jgi:hypothetical protein